MISITIKPDRALSDLVSMFKNEGQERADAVLGQIAYLMTKFVLNQVQLKLTSSRDADTYREAMKIAQVRGLPKGWKAYGITFRSKNQRIRAIDLDRSIVYVQPRRSLNGIAPRIQILVDFGPWTPSGIPFFPKKSEALLIYRKVSLAETARVEKKNKSDRRNWSNQLKRLGWRSFSKDNPFKSTANIKAIEDLVFKALNLEFGLGGTKRVAHWHPAMRSLASVGLGEIVRNDDILAALFRPNSRKWKGWPKKTSTTLNPADVKAGEEFAKRLGL